MDARKSFIASLKFRKKWLLRTVVTYTILRHTYRISMFCFFPCNWTFKETCSITYVVTDCEIQSFYCWIYPVLTSPPGDLYSYLNFVIVPSESWSWKIVQLYHTSWFFWFGYRLTLIDITLINLMPLHPFNKEPAIINRSLTWSTGHK